MPTDPPQGNRQGRADLAAWVASSPASYMEDEEGLRVALRVAMAGDADADWWRVLESYGTRMAAIDALVIENNRQPPRLDSHDAIGNRIDAVVHHPSHEQIGRAIYVDGPMSQLADARWPNTRCMALAYLSSMNGEAGHNCPLACTAGIIKVLQHVDGGELAHRYLPGLTTTDYDQALRGAQFLTEIQGGSDVGANAVSAVRSDDGSYRLSGEKWFCSVIDADLALLTARIIDGDGESTAGTKGLGLFLMPMRSAEGHRNGHVVWRLKDKLGTRSMASGEMTLDGARAWHVGPEADGFRNVMTWVINTSRLFNAVATLGVMRRAWVVAAGYAQHRRAFGDAIVNYPLVQETLALMRADTAAVRAATFHLGSLQDRLERTDETVSAAGLRMLINLNKTLSSRLAHETANRGVEVLGGNGAIETFSVLPRLLRDNVVFENWEGTHNTLMLQWYRDCVSRRMAPEAFGLLEELCAAVPAAVQAEATEQLATCRAEAESFSDMPMELATLQLRAHTDRVGHLLNGLALWRDAGLAGADEGGMLSTLAEIYWRRRIHRDGGADERWLEAIGAVAPVRQAS